MFGFFNRLLVVDVGERSFRIEEIPDALLSDGLGGKGLATDLLLRTAPPGVAPLSPLNPLIVATGPANGSPVHGSSRYGLYTKSPLTGFYSESYSGGRAAEGIVATGFDAVALVGASDDPVYVEVTESGARFHDASGLWGTDTHRAEEALVEAHGGKGRAAALVIGPAGENRVAFSIVANDRWRCAGRTGVGAVMGSKGVKGLVFHGAAEKSFADPGGLEAFARRTARDKADHPATLAYRTQGTPMMVQLLNTVGGFPTRYWHAGRYEKADRISAEAMQARCRVRPRACAKCFIACGKLTEVTSGRHAGLRIEGPEYETIYAFGGLCTIDSIEEIAHLNDLCDRLGLDTITAGNLVALAMEAAERGLLPRGPRYGDARAAAELLEAIASRKGLGEVLAGGIRHAAGELGVGDLAIHVKGMEPAGYDPRALKGMGLAYAVSDRGACHLRATFYKAELSGQIAPDAVEGKAALFIDYEDRATLFDSLILCRFFRDFYLWPELGELIRLTTGTDLDQEGLQRLAGRISDRVRRFNVREGLTPEDDWLPARFFDEPLPETGAVLRREELETMRADYYRLRGWTDDGRPPGKP